MTYGAYKNVRNSVWQVIIDFNIKTLPVSVNKIAEQMGVKIIKDSDIHKLRQGELGLTICINGNWYIVFDDTKSVNMCRFTIAHELGHILLGHILVDKIKYRTFEARDEEERAADMFATRLLAPACVLWALNLHTPQEIARLCDISITSAKIRAERMKILYQRNKFLSSPLERQVYQQFLHFISNQN